MLPINWKTALGYAVLVKVAEAVLPTGDYGAPERAQIAKAGYTYLRTIYADELATDIDPHVGEIVSFGFLAVSPAPGLELVAVIRGTDTIFEWLHDGSFLMLPSPIVGAHGLAEDGFVAVYKSLRIDRADNALRAKDSVKSYLDSGAAASVTVCGHSLGGA